MSDEARREALERLLAEHGTVMRRAIARTCPHNLGLDFDDIEQEARLRLWRALQGENKLHNPASFLYRVAVTATLDAVRRARARPDLHGKEAEPLHPAHQGAAARPAARESGPGDPATGRMILHRLGRLPDARRRAVALHLQGFTTREIAELLHWTEPRARNLVYRGLEQLRRLLREGGIHGPG